MRAGRLRHRVTLRQPSTTASSDGERIETFSDVVEVSAEVLELRGREFLASREAHAEVTAKITIRYRSDIGPTWQVVFGTRTFEVIHVVDLRGRRRTQELMCRELVT